MKKLTAFFSSILLHLVFITGISASGAVATQVASDRAAHVLLI